MSHRVAPAAAATLAAIAAAALTLGACGRNDDGSDGDGGPTLPGSITIQGSVLTVPDTRVVPEPTRP